MPDTNPNDDNRQDRPGRPPTRGPGGNRPPQGFVPRGGMVVLLVLLVSVLVIFVLSSNQNQATADRSKRLNPIRRKQLEERVRELEAEISRAETGIANYEAALQTFVNADETARQTQELSSLRTQLQEFLSEWEDLAHSLEA